MKWQQTFSLTLTICLFLTTGCWDRTELNDLAILLGWGIDIQDDGSYLSTAQIVVPSKASSSSSQGGGQAYYTDTGMGRDVTEAVQNMQMKISRQLFAGHRRDLFIGEALAKHGLADVMDEYSRNPDVRLRTGAFVVKGSTANNLLKTPTPLENIPVLAAHKLHQQVGGPGDVELANFLIDASTEGSSPTLPVLAMVSSFSGQNETQDATSANEFAYAGRAIFDDELKLIGYLNAREAKEALWVKGQLKFLTITGFIPQANGYVSLDLTKLGKQIRPSLRGNHIAFSVCLTGQGMIRENNTDLDLTQVKNIHIVESELDKEAQKQVQQMITKVQQEYKADIFGFGERIHRQYPYQWKVLKKRWETEFPKEEVTVKVHLTIKRVGLTGPSLQLKEKQIKK